MGVTVSIAEDFPLMQSAINDAISIDTRLEVVDCVADARSILDAFVLREPDVALIDLHLPDMDGPRLIERIRRLHPSVKIIVFSACEKPALVLAALNAGASGYIIKRQSKRELCDSIVAVAKGGTVIAPQIANTVLDLRTGNKSEKDNILVGLEQADAQIVRMVVCGETDDQIARAMYVSTRTVQNRLTRIRRIANVGRRTELARWAIENEIV